MNNNKEDIIRVSGYYDIKAVYSIEQRSDNNSLRPLIVLSTRFKPIIEYVSLFFKEYDIRHSIITRSQGFYSLKLSSAKTCNRFFNLLDSEIKFKDEKYNQVFLLTKAMMLKNKDGKQAILSNIKTKLSKTNRKLDEV